MAFLPTGELVTAGDDGALITWVLGDWSTSFRERRVQGGEGLMRHDDRTLAYDLPDGSFVGISADPAIWVDRACAIHGRRLRRERFGECLDRGCDLGQCAGPIAGVRRNVGGAAEPYESTLGVVDVFPQHRVADVGPPLRHGDLEGDREAVEEVGSGVEIGVR